MNKDIFKEASETGKIKILQDSHSMLAAMFEQWCTHHDKRSEEKWDALNRELGKIDKTMERSHGEIFAIKLKLSDEMGKLRCGEHRETFKWHKIFIGGAYAAVILLLTAIVNGWLK